MRDSKARRRFKATMARLMDGEVQVWNPDTMAGRPPELTVSQVKAARAEWAKGGAIMQEMADRYGVHLETMRRVLGEGRFNLASYHARADD